jgi:hypothetical protein
MDKQAKFKRYIATADLIEPFKPTQLQIIRAYGMINQCIFGNALIRPVLKTRYMNDAYGMCYAILCDGKEPKIKPYCQRIVLTPRFESKKHFIEVLAHEMVHQYQAEMQNRMDHGRTFWAWREKFARFGIRLRMRGDAS